MEAEENQPPPPVSSSQSMPQSLGGNGGSAAGMDPALVAQRRERRNQRQAAHINQNIGGREREVSATGKKKSYMKFTNTNFFNRTKVIA